MKNWKPSLPAALLLAGILFIVFVRIRLLTMPLERDEGEFAYAGQLMLQGIPPYQLFYNMKFPGIYSAYAVVMALFGQTDVGIHIGLLLVNLAATGLLYLLARWFLEETGAAAAAATYALLTLSPTVLGFAAHATQFVVPAALAGLLLLLRGEDSGKPVLFLCSGLFFSLACLLKQPGAVFGMFGFVLLVARAARERQRWPAHRARIVSFVAGAVAPILLTGAILWRAGVFDRFWFWTVVYAGEHAREIPLRAGVRYFLRFFGGGFFEGDGLFWIVAAIGFARLAPAAWRDFKFQISNLKSPSPVAAGSEAADAGRGELWLCCFFLFSFAATSLSFYFLPHYYIMTLPAIALLAGRALDDAAEWRRAGGGSGGWAALPPGVFVVLWAWTVFHHRADFFLRSPDQVCRANYGPNPFRECREIGRYIGGHSPPDARIAVLGSEPEIFFYARRHSATGYIYMYDMTIPQPFAETMQAEMIRQVEAARPEYVVFVKVPTSWEWHRDFRDTLYTMVAAWSTRYVGGSYEPAGLVLIGDKPEYFWGRDVLNRPPEIGEFITVFKRK